MKECTEPQNLFERKGRIIRTSSNTEGERLNSIEALIHFLKPTKSWEIAGYCAKWFNNVCIMRNEFGVIASETKKCLQAQNQYSNKNIDIIIKLQLKRRQASRTDISAQKQYFIIRIIRKDALIIQFHGRVADTS